MKALRTKRVLSTYTIFKPMVKQNESIRKLKHSYNIM